MGNNSSTRGALASSDLEKALSDFEGEVEEKWLALRRQAAALTRAQAAVRAPLSRPTRDEQIVALEERETALREQLAEANRRALEAENTIRELQAALHELQHPPRRELRVAVVLEARSPTWASADHLRQSITECFTSAASETDALVSIVVDFYASGSLVNDGRCPDLTVLMSTTSEPYRSEDWHPDPSYSKILLVCNGSGTMIQFPINAFAERRISPGNVAVIYWQPFSGLLNADTAAADAARATIQRRIRAQQVRRE